MARKGPQTYESVISAICEAFGDCLPDEAERQEWPLVQAIFDYRSAREALRLSTGSESDQKFLSDHPELLSGVRSLRQIQRDIDNKPHLMAAIVAFRQAQEEWK